MTQLLLPTAEMFPSAEEGGQEEVSTGEGGGHTPHTHTPPAETHFRVFSV